MPTIVTAPLATPPTSPFRSSVYRRWLAASFFARLPNTMTLLVLVLAGEAATGSVAVGAQIAGVAIGTAGLAAPLRGRGLDRMGLQRGLLQATAVSAAVFFAQAVAVDARVPTILLFALAFVQGVVFAPTAGGYRALLASTLEPSALPRANVLDAVFTEVAFVTGPALAGTLAIVATPAQLLLVMAVFSGLAALITITLPAAPPHVEARSGLAPWRVAGARVVYAIAGLLGLTFGLLEASFPARVEELGRAVASAGPFLALIAAGSAVGGLIASTSSDLRAREVRLAVGLLLAMGASFVPPALLTTTVPLGVALFVSGLPIAPLNALGASRLQHELPPGRLGEGFALYTAVILVGAGTGQVLVGALLPRTGAVALLLAGAAVCGGAGLVLAAGATRRRSAPPVGAAGAP